VEKEITCRGLGVNSVRAKKGLTSDWGIPEWTPDAGDFGEWDPEGVRGVFGQRIIRKMDNRNGELYAAYYRG